MNTLVNAAFQCTACNEDFAVSHPRVLVAGLVFCHRCFHTGIKPQFQAALLNEDDYPPTMGGVTLQISHYQQLLPPSLVRDYIKKSEEYDTLPRRRIYCAASPDCRRFLGQVVSEIVLHNCECGTVTCMCCREVFMSSETLQVHLPHECKSRDGDEDPSPHHGLPEHTRGIDWQICPGPGCKALVSLQDGCNHVTCTIAACKTQFCFLCGEPTGSDRASHWRTGRCMQYGYPGNPYPRRNAVHLDNFPRGRILPPAMPPRDIGGRDAFQPARRRAFHGDALLGPALGLPPLGPDLEQVMGLPYEGLRLNNQPGSGHRPSRPADVLPRDILDQVREADPPRDPMAIFGREDGDHLPRLAPPFPARRIEDLATHPYQSRQPPPPTPDLAVRGEEIAPFRSLFGVARGRVGRMNGFMDAAGTTRQSQPGNYHPADAAAAEHAPAVDDQRALFSGEFYERRNQRHLVQSTRGRTVTRPPLLSGSLLPRPLPQRQRTRVPKFPEVDVQGSETRAGTADFTRTAQTLRRDGHAAHVASHSYAIAIGDMDFPRLAQALRQARRGAMAEESVGADDEINARGAAMHQNVPVNPVNRLVGRADLPERTRVKDGDQAGARPASNDIPRPQRPSPRNLSGLPIANTEAPQQTANFTRADRTESAAQGSAQGAVGLVQRARLQENQSEGPTRRREVQKRDEPSAPKVEASVNEE